VFTCLNVMRRDSLESSNPVNKTVNNELESIFEKFSNDKGASIIRMMNAFLTEPTFRRGVSVRS